MSFNKYLALIKRNKISFTLFFILYLLLASFISGFFKTIPLIIIYASTVSWVKLTLSFTLTLIISILISINLILLKEKIKERRSCAQQSTIAGIATLGGLAVGVCPICVTGISALILGALGIGFSFATLPFQGIEIQALLILILVLNIKLLSK
ncbi:MAG: hypothetical protein AABW79_03025 [Nanoarchaeota archaeon]